MKNFIELYKVLDGHTDDETLEYLIFNYLQDVVEKAQEIKHNKTTRESALNSYKKVCENKGVRIDPDNGIYCDGHTALSLNVNHPAYDETLPAFKCLHDVIKSNRKPEPLRDSINYAIAAAKVNGWKMGDNNYYITVGKATYNLSLVARIFNCIADNKTFNDCNIEQVISDNPQNAILVLRSRYGFGIILPFRHENMAGFYDVTPAAGTLDKLIEKHENKIKEVA